MVGRRDAAAASQDEAALYQGIVDAAATVSGARYVNLSWLESDGWIRGSAWALTDATLLERALTAARYVMPGFDPIEVRFRSDVNAAVRRVFIEGRPHFAAFNEHVEGTVHPLIAGLGGSVLGLQWTHSVPLVGAGRVAGALAFHWPHRPHPRSLGVAEAFSMQAALTFENVRLSAALRARASDLERSRERIASAAEETRQDVARTLDGVASRMLVATQRVLGCRALLALSPGYAATELARIAEELERLREDDVRAASHRLHPALTGVGLLPALEMLSDSFADLDVRVAASPGVSALDDIAHNVLPAGVRVAVYRFVEDALGWIAARGGARGARIEISIQDGALRTAILDEGGRALAGSPETAISAMRDRIEGLDGAVEVDAGPAGMRVTAVVPLPASGRRRTAMGPATKLFQSIADNALGVTGARMVSLSTFDPMAGAHQLAAVAPLGSFDRMVEAARTLVPDLDAARMRMPLHANAAIRTVLVEGRSLLAPTAEYAAGTIPQAVLRAATRMLGFRWTYAVPLRLDGHVAGALAFHFADQPASASRAVADTFASQAALTLANERLAATLSERTTVLAGSRERVDAAEERVRREIAEFLHGRVQSRLLVVSHRLLEACASLASDPAGAASALDGLARELDRIREVDLAQAIGRLHPSAVSVGLMVALRQLADELSPKLDVTLTADGSVVEQDGPARSRVPERIRLGVYRTVQEALANVARHAGTTAAAVQVQLEDGCLRTIVSDAGRGYDPATARAGMGLRTMRDRVERLGGTLSIDSVPGRGTTVLITLPLERSG